MERTVVVFSVFLLFNILTFFLCGYDKYLAIYKKYRISELVFWFLILLGGSLGFYLGMNLFHHKTKKLKFRYGVPLIFFCQIILLVFVFSNIIN